MNVYNEYRSPYQPLRIDQLEISVYFQIDMNNLKVNLI